MEWFSRKTSIAGTQISNWILVLASGSRRNLDYLLIRRTLSEWGTNEPTTVAIWGHPYSLMLRGKLFQLMRRRPDVQVISSAQ
jgi:hypothetical protein